MQIEVLFGTNGTLMDTPFLRARLEDLQEQLIDKLEGKKLSNDNASDLVLPVVVAAYRAGIDYSFDLQNAFRKFAEGDLNALAPFFRCEKAEAVRA